MPTANATEDADELERVHREHPRWHAFISSTGRKWASRIAPIVWNPQKKAAWSMTIDADTWEELEKQIEYQDSIS